MENKIYVGTYYKYNNGSIFGDWINVNDLSKDEFFEMCKELHKDEDEPEFMFQDWEVSEILESFITNAAEIEAKFWEIKEQIKDLSDEQIESLTAFNSIFGSIDIEDCEEKFFCHIEEYNVNKSFGEYMLEEMGELEQVPHHLRYYIDSESYGRDLLINDFCEYNGFIFRNC